MGIDLVLLGGTSIDLIQSSLTMSKRPLFQASVGGSITNSAVISAKLGLKTALLSRIGRDPLGDFAVNFLRAAGVNTDGVIQDSTVRTPIAIANIDKKGNSRYTFYKNPPSQVVVPLDTVPEDLLKGVKAFHFGSSFSHEKGTYEVCLEYVKFLKKRGVFICFDPNIRPYALKDRLETKKRVIRLLKIVDLARLNEIDLEFLTGQKDPKNGLKDLKKRFSCEVVLTLGSRGSMYLSLRGAKRRSNLIKIPAFKVRVADTIGAGDAFTSGLLFRIIKIGEREVFNDIKPHLIFASAVSALICTRPGANQGLKDLKQVNSFLYK